MASLAAASDERSARRRGPRSGRLTTAPTYFTGTDHSTVATTRAGA